MIKTAAQTSYYEDVEFVENNIVYRIFNKQLIKKNNKDYYMYQVSQQHDDKTILVDAKIAQKKTCKAIYKAIQELQD